MDIYQAIRRIASEGMCLCDIGTAVHVDEGRGRCDVEIAGKAPAVDAWLTIGDAAGGIMTVPEEGSDVVVMWLSQSVAVVVMVAQASKIVLRGGKQGGLVLVEGVKQRLNTLEKAINELKQVMTAWEPVASDGGAALKVAVASWAAGRIAETEAGDLTDDKIVQ